MEPCREQTNTSTLTPAEVRACWCSFSSNGRQGLAGRRGGRAAAVSPAGLMAQVWVCSGTGVRWGDGPCGWAGLCIRSATITQKPLLGPAQGAVVLEEEGHLR